jgi:hypothetical protein
MEPVAILGLCHERKDVSTRPVRDMWKKWDRQDIQRSAMPSPRICNEEASLELILQQLPADGDW